MHIEADALIRCRQSFLGFAQFCLCLVHLRCRRLVVKDAPRRTQAEGPHILGLHAVLKGVLTRNRARRCRIQRRKVRRRCLLNRRLCLLDRIMRCRRIRTVDEAVVRAVRKGEIVRRIAHLVARLQRRIRRQTDHIVQRRDGDGIVVLCRGQRLLRIRELHLRGEHICTRHRTRAELRIHIVEMLRERRNRLLTHLHHVARLQDVEIIRCRRQANGLLRLLQREIRRVQPVACLLALGIHARIKEYHREGSLIFVCILVGGWRKELLRLTADTSCRPVPREQRPRTAVCHMQLLMRSVHIRERLFDRAVVRERHLHAVRKADLYRLRRHWRGKEPNRRTECESTRETPCQSSLCLQIHFLLIRSMEIHQCCELPGNPRTQKL